MPSQISIQSSWPYQVLTNFEADWFDVLAARSVELTRFALIMLLAACIALALQWLDPRSIRGVSVWAKPFKFMLSTGLFALTSAWLLGLIPESQRSSSAIVATIWVLIATASFEVVYITIQGALGQASHYNTGSAFHSAMFGLMAFAAVGLTATQAVIAWQIFVHCNVKPIPPVVWGAIAGLSLTFLLGTISGFTLGGNQPPAGKGVVLFGWQTGFRDFRPAHFLGVHAHQFLPLAGILIQRWVPPRWGTLTIFFATALYVLIWLYTAQMASRMPSGNVQQ